VATDGGEAAIAERMVRVIRQILTDAECYAKWCKNAASARERFSMAALTELYESAFRSALSQG
jgi:hypothetical protein